MIVRQLVVCDVKVLLPSPATLMLFRGKALNEQRGLS